MIVLVYDDCPQIDEHQLRVYLDMLKEAGDDWKNSEDHCMEVIFPKQFEAKLNL